MDNKLKRKKMVALLWSGGHFDDDLYPVMKPFSHDGSGHLQDGNLFIHRAWGLTEWFDEHESNVHFYVFI